MYLNNHSQYKPVPGDHGMVSRSHSSSSRIFSAVLLLTAAESPERAELPMTTKLAPSSLAVLTITLPGSPILMWTFSLATPQALYIEPLSGRLDRSLWALTKCSSAFLLPTYRRQKSSILALISS